MDGGDFQPPPGWYADGTGVERYWSGTDWSDRTRPIVPTGPQAPPQPVLEESRVGPSTIGHDERLRLLDQLVRQLAANGWVAQSQVGYQVVMSTAPRQRPHGSHFWLTVFTCGIWLIFWIIDATIPRGGRTVTFTVDEYGRGLRSDGPGGTWRDA